MIKIERNIVICSVVDAEEWVSSNQAAAVITMSAPFIHFEAASFAQSISDPGERQEFMLRVSSLNQKLGTGLIPHHRSGLFHAPEAEGFRRHLAGPEERILMQAIAIKDFAHAHLPSIEADQKAGRKLVIHCIEGHDRSAFAALILFHHETNTHRENDVSQSFAKALAGLYRVRPQALVGITNRMFFDVCFGFGAWEEIERYKNTMHRLNELREAAKPFGFKSVKVLLSAPAANLPEALRGMVDGLRSDCARYEIANPKVT